MNKKFKKWYRLDNAAKIFPPTISKKDPKIFWFSLELYEKIDQKILEKALMISIKEYPIFLSELKRGLFWYYLEESNLQPIIIEETFFPCTALPTKLLFQVSYFNNRINLEAHHVLTDGAGTLQFLKSLIINYLTIKYNINQKFDFDDSSIEDKIIDSFNMNYTVSKLTFENKKRAYKIKNDLYLENRLKIISGVASAKDILKISKKYNVTLTIFLTSLLIKSIGSTMTQKNKKKNITIEIPVNLRKYFPSNTVRNFFNTISINYNLLEEGEELENIIKLVNNQFKAKLNKDYLIKKMNNFLYFEKNFIIRLIPVFIKDLVLKYIFKGICLTQTMTFSNVGIITMPDELKKYIKLVDVFTSTNSIQACMCTYEDNLVISFTSHFKSAEIQKNFFRELAKHTDNLVINANVIGDEDEEM